jgi:hypothetical protein
MARVCLESLFGRDHYDKTILDRFASGSSPQPAGGPSSIRLGCRRIDCVNPQAIRLGRCARIDANQGIGPVRGRINDDGRGNGVEDADQNGGCEHDLGHGEILARVLKPRTLIARDRELCCAAHKRNENRALRPGFRGGLGKTELGASHGITPHLEIGAWRIGTGLGGRRNTYTAARRFSSAAPCGRPWTASAL